MPTRTAQHSALHSAVQRCSLLAMMLLILGVKSCQGSARQLLQDANAPSSQLESCSLNPNYTSFENTAYNCPIAPGPIILCISGLAQGVCSTAGKQFPAANCEEQCIVNTTPAGSIFNCSQYANYDTFKNLANACPSSPGYYFYCYRGPGSRNCSVGNNNQLPDCAEQCVVDPQDSASPSPPPPPPSSTPSTPPSSTPSTPSPAPAPLSPPPDVSLAASSGPSSGDKGSGSLSGGAIGGIVVGVLAGLAVLAAMAVFLIRRRRQGKRGEPTMLGGESSGSDRPTQLGASRGSIELKEVTSERMSGILSASAVPYSQIIRTSDVVHMEDIDLPEAQDSSISFDSLPAEWHIPLSSVSLMCHGEKAIVLGKGGYGMVYKAMVRKREAAIKIVWGGGKQEQARLLNEITTLERCKSVDIVQFLGYSISEDGLLLCMEYMSGGTLYNSLGRSNEFQWYNRGWRAMRGIAAGLYCLHEQDVAHLDLKTPNILIGADKKVKIADLGLGKLVKGNETQASQLGTLAWMAPEVLLRGTCALQSDVWSFGTILWEVCTLRRPVQSLSVDDIRVPDQAPQELVDLIRECRADNYRLRPAMGEICDRLDSISRANVL